MNRYFLLLVLFLFAATGVFAQKTFVFKKISNNYDVKVKIANCEEELCNDKATVYVMKKGQTNVFQTIQMEEMYIRSTVENTNFDKASGELSGDDMIGIHFEDYNFDGADDLAVSNGYYAPYGGISYDILLFNKAKGSFVKHTGLTTLSSENMGVDVDKKKKTIETFTKSGCCWHQTARYKFIKNRLVKIYVFTEDAAGVDSGPGGKIRLITETLVKGRWRKKTKTMRFDDYYKDEQ
jgi:hypothetical protein